MSNITKHIHIKGVNGVPDYNVNKIRVMSDSEAEKRAKNDPDAPIITSKMMRKVNRK